MSLLLEDMKRIKKYNFGTQPKDRISGKDGISDDDIAGDECTYYVIING